MPSAHDLYRATEHVIGQAKARKQLAVLLERQQMVADGILPDTRQGAILAGWTGSGKTYLAESMCRLAGLPFASVNATQYTEAGYVGLNLTQMFLPLIMDAAGPQEAGGEQTSVLERQDVLERASVGVVLLDEFDKWLYTGEDAQGRNTGKKLQSELLKMVEGSIEYVTDSDDELGAPFDTTKVLIICAGAFVGLSARVARDLGREDADDGMWDLIEPYHFVRYGMMPELAGRLATHIFTRPLREEHLTTILLKEGGVVEEYRSRFEALGVAWAVPDESIRDIARIALSRNTGARGVNHVMWQRFSEALFEASLAQGPQQVTYAVNSPRAILQPRLALVS